MTEIVNSIITIQKGHYTQSQTPTERIKHNTKHLASTLNTIPNT